MLSGAASASVALGRCLLYERGQCRQGNACRYLHDVDTVSSDCRDDGLMGVPHYQDPTTSVKPCRYFLRNGWCAFGSKCRFSHRQKPLPAAESSDVGNEEGKPEAGKSTVGGASGEEGRPEVQKSTVGCAGGEEGKLQAQKSTVGNGPRAPHTESDRRKPCWFFKRGRCHFGEKCRHRHIAASKARGGVTEQPKQASETGQRSETADPRQTSSTTEKESHDVTHPSCAKSLTLPEVSSSVQEAADSADKLDTLRSTEITQLRRRYPRAVITETDDGSTAAKFVFEPSDPDWVITFRHLVT